MWVFALFLAIPLIEIALFVTVGGWLTLWPTLAIVLGTGVLGVFILRQQGLRAISDVQTAMQNMQSPLPLVANSALVMVAGVLLVLPGFFTDTLGLLLLIPHLRQWVINRIVRKAQHFSSAGQRTDWRDGPPSRYDDEVIDAEYREIDPEQPGLRGNSRWTQD